jgi:hypothetical protein
VTVLGIPDLIGDGEATLADLSEKAGVESYFLGECGAKSAEDCIYVLENHRSRDELRGRSWLFRGNRRLWLETV